MKTQSASVVNVISGFTAKKWQSCACGSAAIPLNIPKWREKKRSWYIHQMLVKQQNNTYIYILHVDALYHLFMVKIEDGGSYCFTKISCHRSRGPRRPRRPRCSKAPLRRRQWRSVDRRNRTGRPATTRCELFRWIFNWTVYLCFW